MIKRNRRGRRARLIVLHAQVMQKVFRVIDIAVKYEFLPLTKLDRAERRLKVRVYLPNEIHNVPIEMKVI